MIFLVLSRKMIFLFPGNIILFFRRKMKDDLSEKRTWKYDIFSNVLKRWCFQKNSTGIWSFFLYYLKRWYFFFPKLWSYAFDGKWKVIFLKKNTWKYDIFFKCPKKIVFPKTIALEYDISCIIWKDGVFLQKIWFFFFGWKLKDNLFQEIHGNMYFVYICINVTNMILPFY